MLELKQIAKQYVSGDSTVNALGGVSLRFRPSEFVSILGPSGCGKTTMLNIIGGLDRYTSGDLVINGRSTREFSDRDWDTYRNHSIGFVFQSYNLIPHQTVLSNVELALTLSGVSRAERRARAIEALKQVGLGDQLQKKPNQMSGGQMQRVAIARALVNNPDILLADEPTGALDTQTSIQIMGLLKEVAKDRLVIMVTHNPELAEEYSTRIVRLQDGMILSDTAPVDDDELEALLAQTKKEEKAEQKLERKQQKAAKKAAKKAEKKTSMSFGTALSLSKNNLLTKKGRTILTSFAGSIGIIGIALILALSNGIQAYIDTVQEDTLSTYPLTIEATTADYASMMAAMMEVSEETLENPDPNKIYVDDSLGTMMSAMTATVENDLTSFKKYLEEHYDEIKDSVSDIKYTYNFDLQVYTADGKVRVSPTEIFNNMGDMFSGMSDMIADSGMFGVMSEMIDNQALLDQQYELVGEGSHWPTAANEVVLVVGKDNRISKMTLYMLGVLDQSLIEDELASVLDPNSDYESSHMQPYDLSEFLGRKFMLVNTSDYFTKTGGSYTVDGVSYPIWQDMREYGFKNKDGAAITQEQFITENGTELVISGIVRPRDGVTGTSISYPLGYSKGLTDLILKWNTESEIIAQQKKTPNNNVLGGATFERTPYTRENIGDLIERVGSTNMNRFYGVVTAMLRDEPQFQGIWNDKALAITMYVSTLDDKEMAACIADLLENAKAMTAADPSGTASMQLEGFLGSLPTMDPNGLTGVTINSDTVVKLLPILSDKQVMVLVGGLQNFCSPAKTDALFADIQAKLAGGEWQVNEKFITLMLDSKNEDGTPLLNDEMFATFEATLYDMVPDKDVTYETMLVKLGDAEEASPATINFYAKDFASKDQIEAFIQTYNDSVDEDKKIQYTDMVGLLMSAVSTIIDVISYVLIAFVSISLVVSSIMIGIITYISVLERTKEIGILRAIGASKKDISRVFNAETLIVGFAAGLIGIAVTLLLTLPINAIIRALSGIHNIGASLPPLAAVILVGISMFLTFIAGLIPSKIASKKDPVEALRSE